MKLRLKFKNPHASNLQTKLPRIWMYKMFEQEKLHVLTYTHTKTALNSWFAISQQPEISKR